MSSTGWSGSNLWPDVRRGMLILSIALSLVGCGAAKEKTAPCKRPANLSGYAADPRIDCGPMRLVNSRSHPALTAIGESSDQSQ